MARIDRNLGIAACIAALLLLAVAAIGGKALAAGPDAPTVSGAWLRLPVVAGRPAAVYATITGSKMADRLIAVEGPKPARFELHATKAENGVMRMVPLVGVPVAAGAKIEMKPGGMHVMVFGLPETKPDARVPLTFVFEKAGRVSVSAHAMNAAAPAMTPGEHEHH